MKNLKKYFGGTMKKIVVFILLIFTCYALTAQQQTNMYYRGDMNGWGETAMTCRDLGTDSWKVTILSDGDDNLSEFKFSDSNVAWDNAWGRGDVVTINDLTIWYHDGGNSQFNESNGKYYTFIFKDVADGNNSEGYVLETSEQPETITDVSDNYSGPGVAVTVTVTLSGTKCTEERVIVRYTTDNWSNSSFVETSSGSNPYYATIPSGGVTGTANNQYYVLTSTVVPTHSTADLLTINYSNNGGDNWTLPVSLSTFTAQYLTGKPLLYWTTQSETDNMGWFVYRNQVEDFTTATKVSGMIDGHGTTTQMQSYIYEDAITNPQVDDVYYYWLESVDYSGTIHHFDKVAMITIPETNDPNPNVTPPQVYDLISSPNPFNKTTNIKFTLTQTAFVDVAIFDVKGALVKSFDTKHVTADQLVSLSWDGKDENGKSLSNGIYLYSVKVNEQDYATKQVILMK